MKTLAALHRPFFIGALVLLISLHSAQADSRAQMARVDVSGILKAPFDFDVTAVSNGATIDELKSDKTIRHYILHFPATSEWQEGSITLKATTGGSLVLAMLGPNLLIENKPAYIEYDDVKADKAIIKNGGFEAVASDGSLRDWNLISFKAGKPPVDDSNQAAVRKGDAFDGKNFIHVWHNSRFSQAFVVEENVPVVVSFRYRLGKQDAEKE